MLSFSRYKTIGVLLLYLARDISCRNNIRRYAADLQRSQPCLQLNGPRVFVRTIPHVKRSRVPDGPQSPRSRASVLIKDVVFLPISHGLFKAPFGAVSPAPNESLKNFHISSRYVANFSQWVILLRALHCGEKKIQKSRQRRGVGE